MAIVDVNSGKIIGCKPGTLTYWHEQGHILYSRKNFGMTLQFYGQGFFVISVGVLVLNVFYNTLLVKVWIVVSFLLFLATSLFEELWCWSYAFTKRHKLLKYGAEHHHTNQSKKLKVNQEKNKKEKEIKFPDQINLK